MPLKLLLDWRLWVAIAVALALAAAGSFLYDAGAKAVKVKWDADVIQWSTERTRVLGLYRDQEQFWQRVVGKERQDATKREIELRNDLAGADRALDGLREQSTDLARRIATAPRETAVNAAVAFGNLLTNCSASYRGLAESCDRHVSDLRTCQNTWPVNQVLGK